MHVLTCCIYPRTLILYCRLPGDDEPQPARLRPKPANAQVGLLPMEQAGFVIGRCSLRPGAQAHCSLCLLDPNTFLIHGASGPHSQKCGLLSIRSSSAPRLLGHCFKIHGVAAVSHACRTFSDRCQASSHVRVAVRHLMHQVQNLS